MHARPVRALQPVLAEHDFRLTVLSFGGLSACEQASAQQRDLKSF